MSEKTTTPSLLSQAERVIDAQPEGFAAGVLVQDGTVGAEVSHVQDVGKKGGWKLASLVRWTRAKGKEAAAHVRWTPKG